MPIGDANRWRDLCGAIYEKNWVKVARMVHMYKTHEGFTEEEFERIFAFWKDIKQNIERAELISDTLRKTFLRVDKEITYCPQCNASVFSQAKQFYECIPRKALIQSKLMGHWEIKDVYVEHECP